MKITIFNGSPRGENGNTHIMTEEFAAGARSAGAEVETVLLSKKKIGHCLGCFKCWIDTPGNCVLKDDMEELLVKFMVSDVVVFATPLYVDNVTGIMKNFMDRMISKGDPHFDKNVSGECCHKKKTDTPPKFVVISNCGFPEQSHFQVLRLLFRRIARNFCTDLIAEIYRGEGELLKHNPLILKPIIWKYKHLLRKAGKEVVLDLKLSPETIEELEKPLIPEEQYIRNANKSFDEKLKK